MRPSGLQGRNASAAADGVQVQCDFLPPGDAGGDGWCSQHSSCKVLLPGDALQLLCAGVLHRFGCTTLSVHAVCPVLPQCKFS